MTLLLIAAVVYGGLFLLALALVSINSRVVVPEPTMAELQLNPGIFETEPEKTDSLRDVMASRVVSSTPRRAKRVAGDKQRIFVVDDDPDILKLIEHVLDIEGFDVRSFTDPNEALEAFNSTAQAQRPEMVLTDYCMGPMNGLELISRCRQTAPELKTMVISGMVDEDALAKMPEKTDRFLAKPFKVANLVQSLNETLAEVSN